MASPATLFHDLGLIDDRTISFRIGAPGPHLLKKSAYLFERTSPQFIVSLAVLNNAYLFLC